MSIVERFTTIMKSNINALLDKCENPSKMIDQYIRDCREDLAEAKKETAIVMAEETRCRKLLEDNQRKIDRYLEVAKSAIAAGEDNVAEEAIAKKQELEEKAREYQKLYDVASQNADKLKKAYNKLVNDLRELESRRDTIKAKAAIVKTQQRVSGFSNKGFGKTMDAIDRMEAKVDSDLAISEAYDSLGEEIQDDSDKIIEDFCKGSVKDELAKLKAEMGQE